MGLRLIDLTLLVRGMQGVIERVGLNNSGLLLQAEVWLVVGLIGWGSGWLDRCGTGGVGTKPRPLLSIEVSSLVRVQEDKFIQWSLFFTLFGLCLC